MTHTNANLKPYKIALKVLFNIMNEWKIEEKKQRILLGNPAIDVFKTWKCGEVTSLESDVLVRISYMMGIYKNLRALFPLQGQANEWLLKPNSAFGEASALDFMLLGQMANLREVRHYLDAQFDYITSGNT